MNADNPMGPRLDRLGQMITERAERAAADCAVPRYQPCAGDVELARASRSQQWRNAIPSRFQWACVDEFTNPDAGGFYMPVVAGDLAAWGSPDCAAPLVIYGPIGSCKTFAAVAAARLKFDRGSDVIFQPVVEMLRLLRPGGDSEGLVDELCWIDLLILDDLGTEKSSEWTAEQLYEVVNRRWMEALPTIVTTNLAPSDLLKGPTARVFSRLVGDGARVVGMTGKDRRLYPAG